MYSISAVDIQAIAQNTRVNVQRLDGLLLSLQLSGQKTTSTAQITSQLETLISELQRVSNRLGVSTFERAQLVDLSRQIGQSIVDFTAIRDVSLPNLATLTTNPTADDFDLQRNAADGQLDAATNINSPLLSDRAGVVEALDRARGIIDGTAGVVGDADAYNRFINPGIDPVLNPTIAPDLIANLDATDPASVNDTDANGRAEELLDTAPLDANNNNATENGGQDPLIVAGAFGGAVGQALQFDGTNDRLLIGADGAEFDVIASDQRTFFFTFETGADTVARQVIFDQSDDATGGGGTVGEGVTLYIEGNQLRFVAAADGDSPGGQFNTAVRATVAPNTAYVVAVTVDQTSGTTQLSGRLNGAAFDVTPNASAPAGRTLAFFDLANGGSAIGASDGGIALDGGQTAAGGSNFAGTFGQAVVADRALTATEIQDSENFFSTKFGVPLAGGVAGVGQAQALQDIQTARTLLTDTITTLQAELDTINQRIAGIDQEIVTLNETITSLTENFSVTATTTTSRASILPTVIQIANPQAFGVIDTGAFLNELI